MFTLEEFQRLVGEIPEDFEKTTNEFWSYIQSRLRTLSKKIRWVTSDVFLQDREKVTIGEEERTVIDELVNSGVKIQVLEDSTIIGEVKSWRAMVETTSSQVISELYEESLLDLSHFLTNLVKETLQDGEVGILLFDSQIPLSFPEEIRVIRMIPFNPQDYLNRHRVQKQIKQTHNSPLMRQ
jgi:hypothetical protein